MRSRPAIALIFVAALSAACARGTDDATVQLSPSPTPAASSPGPSNDETPVSDPSPAATPQGGQPDGTEAEGAGTGDAVDPVGELSRQERRSTEFPSLAGEVALLTDVRVAAHGGFDRVVLEFDGGEVPSYRVGFIDPPIITDGRGDEVAIDGSAFLELRMTPAAGVDLSGQEARITYDGPRRVTGPDTAVVTEIVGVGDFESNLAWVVGLQQEAPFAVEWLTDPLRLVVDIGA